MRDSVLVDFEPDALTKLLLLLTTDVCDVELSSLETTEAATADAADPGGLESNEPDDPAPFRSDSNVCLFELNRELPLLFRLSSTLSSLSPNVVMYSTRECLGRRNPLRDPRLE